MTLRLHHAATILLAAACLCGVAVAQPAGNSTAAADDASSASGAAGEVSPLTDFQSRQPRKPTIIVFDPPEFSAANKAEKRSAVVDVKARVGIDGHIGRADIVSPPSPFDDAVRAALPQWILVPPTCKAVAIDRYELRFSIPFTVEGDRFFVALRGMQYNYVGNEKPERRVWPRLASEPPRFPKSAMRKGLRAGWVLMRFRVDATGKVTDADVPFSYPAKEFVQPSIDAALDWTFKPEGDLEPWEACVEFRYSLPR